MTTKAIGQVSRLETVVPAVAKLIAGLADLVLEHDPLARLKVTSSDASRQLYEVDIFSTLTDWEIAGFVAPWTTRTEREFGVTIYGIPRPALGVPQTI